MWPLLSYGYFSYSSVINLHHLKSCNDYHLGLTELLLPCCGQSHFFFFKYKSDQVTTLLEFLMASLCLPKTVQAPYHGHQTLYHMGFSFSPASPTVLLALSTPAILVFLFFLGSFLSLSFFPLL